jgi:hypothetical protein
MSGPIDVHCHWCVFDAPTADLDAELVALAGEGHSLVVVYVLASLGLPPAKVPHLIPAEYHTMAGLEPAGLDPGPRQDGHGTTGPPPVAERGGESRGQGRRVRLDDLESWFAFEAALKPPVRGLGSDAGAQAAAGLGRPGVIPFLDVRGWDGELDLRPLMKRGFWGLKDVIFLEEDIEKMRIAPLRHLWGFTREQYLDRHRKLFALAEELKVPLVYHADLTAHGDFVAECLEAHPGVRVEIPHFGFSRRAMADFLHRYPGLFTDFASLAEHMEAAPDRYRRFIEQFADRVLFGSDSLVGCGLEPSRRYARLVGRLGLSQEMQEKVLWGNAQRFLALPGTGG